MTIPWVSVAVCCGAGQVLGSSSFIAAPCRAGVGRGWGAEDPVAAQPGKLKKDYRLWTAQGRSAAGREFWKEYAAKVIAPKLASNVVSPVNLPGKGGAVLDTVMGVHDISGGRKDRNYVRDGTYGDVLGRYTRGVQDVIDAVA